MLDREKIRTEFRAYLNEATASSVKSRELAARTNKETEEEYKKSKKDATKVKIDKMFKFNLPKNLIGDRDIISTDIENSQSKGIKAKYLGNSEYEVFGKKFTYVVPEQYITEIK